MILPKVKLRLLLLISYLRRNLMILFINNRIYSQNQWYLISNQLLHWQQLLRQMYKIICHNCNSYNHRKHFNRKLHNNLSNKIFNSNLNVHLDKIFLNLLLSHLLQLLILKMFQNHQQEDFHHLPHLLLLQTSISIFKRTKQKFFHLLHHPKLIYHHCLDKVALIFQK